MRSHKHLFETKKKKIANLKAQIEAENQIPNNVSIIGWGQKVFSEKNEGNNYMNRRKKSISINKLSYMAGYWFCLQKESL